MGHPDPSLVEALEQARDRRPRVEEVVRDYASTPTEVKATATPCADCEAPCTDEEVCATVVAREEGLLDRVTRDQAFHHVESRMNRLKVHGEAVVRNDGNYRPSTFVELVADSSARLD